MRAINCNLCGSDEYALVDAHRKDKYCRPEVEVRAVICKHCGLVYVNPQIDESELHNLYATNYAETRHDLPDEKVLQRMEAMAEERWKWLEKRAPMNGHGGKVLDMGCSAGSLLNAFQKKGWDAYGVEPTPHYAEFARERYGLKITTGFLEEANLPSSYYDMVTLTQTLEHLADPTQALLRIRGLLKDGGLVYIDVPNIVKPKHFRFFEAPHLYTFSPNTMSLLLRKTGFEPIIIENGWDVRAVARKGGTVGNIDFSSQGDDYKEIISNLKWRHARLWLHLAQGWLTSKVSLTIRRTFGESAGRKILGLIKRLLHQTEG